MRTILFAFVILSQVACISAKKQTAMISDYSSILSGALKPDLNTEQKIDILGNTLVDVMEQSLKFKSTVKGGKFVQKFGESNGPIIEQIVGEIQNEIESQDPISQMSMAMGLLKKPYISELINLLPQFEKKFKRIAWVANLASKVGKPLQMLQKTKNSGLGKLFNEE